LGRMEPDATRHWPTWVWYAMVVVTLAILLIVDLAGWLDALDPVRTP
jgi:hypothetical protein